ncbi:hypothetical protein DSM106972_090820 [Dulcicalothrix desertica PCC 7102]|uniref:DUF1822 domain-containing protein n=1 Tax=Dulcicalothrix desertica PCC 7102 TaxID=232991 RepID=A0A433UN90_9CYAN|nr:DUF1822 family protein [Dulcicalothrix desertica]RUS95306.1 hypothetical protein DSM106972_090820 [Dulcicalothrix desertica PCC 7102]TWH43994.1 uncharacterized protein DUF1822 [Dulcicalothrix desertica PCC 7102]
MIFEAKPQEWWLEVPSLQQQKFWEQSQQHTTVNSRWNAYVNRICLYTMLELIRDDAPQASIWLGASNMPAVWDIVNGSAITIGTTKIVIIPTEAIDDELEVPQEWVDIPSWVGDYYIAVQFRSEGNLRIWGYTTHQELKNNSTYDPEDRTYCIDASNLTCDMDTFWVRYECYPETSTRGDVSFLPELSVAQAENLIKCLGNAEVVFPRLAVPFTTWGALLKNQNWLSSLFATRRGIETSATITQLTRLSEWLHGRIDNIWQTIENTLSNQQVATAWRSQNTQSLTTQNQNPIFTINRVKILDFASSGNEQVALLIGILPISDNEVTIGVEIRPIDNAVYLPNDVQVRLLDENGDEVGQANALVTQTIQFQFGGQQSEMFSIEVTCGGQVITEHFVI